MSDASQKLALFRTDAFAGVLVMSVAGIFFYGAWKLRAGTLERMGPGYVPIAMSIFLLLIGALLTINALVRRGAGEGATFPSLRPTLIVVLSPLLFAFLIERAGLVITVFIVTIFARFAQPQKRGIEMIALPVLLTLFSVLVFVYALKLSIPLWPALT